MSPSAQFDPDTFMASRSRPAAGATFDPDTFMAARGASAASQHVPAHPLAGHNFGDWLSEELLDPIVSSATALGRGMAGFADPTKAPTMEHAKDLVNGAFGVALPFMMGGLGGKEPAPPGAPKPSAVAPTGGGISLPEIPPAVATAMRVVHPLKAGLAIRGYNLLRSLVNTKPAGITIQPSPLPDEVMAELLRDSGTGAAEQASSTSTGTSTPVPTPSIPPTSIQPGGRPIRPPLAPASPAERPVVNQPEPAPPGAEQPSPAPLAPAALAPKPFSRVISNQPGIGATTSPIPYHDLWKIPLRQAAGEPPPVVPLKEAVWNPEGYRATEQYSVRAGEHFMAAQDAVNEGKPVPPEVLADYPQLQKQAQGRFQEVGKTTEAYPETLGPGLSVFRVPIEDAVPSENPYALGKGPTVQEYAERLKSGEEPPPLYGRVNEEGKVSIADGNTRLEAQRQAGAQTVDVATSNPAPFREQVPKEFYQGAAREVRADRAASLGRVLHEAGIPASDLGGMELSNWQQVAAAHNIDLPKSGSAQAKLFQQAIMEVKRLEAEKAATNFNPRATIKPPPGFSLGEHKNYFAR
jgi:hypothetical protein